jgi:cell wall assembly regulator SMI1
MSGTDWRALLDPDRRGLQLGPPASAGDLSELEARIGQSIPTDLRDLLAVANGFDDLAGQWQVAWDAERIVTENDRMWRAAVIDSNRLAFGDNGAGDPFCLVLNGDDAGTVEERSLITLDAARSWPSLDEFWTDWLSQ